MDVTMKKSVREPDAVRYSGRRAFFTVLFGLVAISIACGGGGDQTATPEPTAALAATPAPTPTPTPAPVPVADGVTLVATWRPEADGNPWFNFPSGIAIDASGNVYVINNLVDSRVQIFSPEGSTTVKCLLVI